jgi:hypothetical protein
MRLLRSAQASSSTPAASADPCPRIPRSAPAPQWHVEDFLLQSINLMMIGRPKAWWWVPKAAEEAFKELLEDQWEIEE